MSTHLAVSLACVMAAASAAADPGAQGIVLLSQGRYREAAAVFDQAIAKDPRDARALANRCTARYKLGDHDGALADFEAAVRLKPKLKAGLVPSMSDAYYRRSRRRVDQGADEAAAQDLYASVRLDRRNSLAYSELGFLAVRSRQYDVAIPYFNRALAIDPDLAPAYASRAAARMALGRGAEAFADMDRAILIDHRNGSYFASRARIAVSIGRLPQALKDARRAVEFDPGQAAAVKDLLPESKK